MSLSTPNTTPLTNSRKPILKNLEPLLFVVTVLGPFLALLINLANDIFSGNADWITLLLPQGRRLTLLFRSLGLAMAVSISGLILGLAVALFIWRWREGPLSILRWFLLILVPLPPYLHALGWSAFFVEINALLTSSGLPQIVFRGWIASWWVQLMALAPIAIGLCLIGLESIDARLIDAARVIRTDFESLRRVILPLAAPILLAGGAVLFLLSLIDYSVPSLFQVTTYPLEIFADFSANNEPARAFLLSVPLLLITLGMIAFCQASLRNAALRPPWKARLWDNPPRWPSWLAIIQGTAVVLLIAQILVPLMSQIVLAGSFTNILSTTGEAQAEILSTLWISSLAAVLSLPIALPVAGRLLGNQPHWWVITSLPLAVPSPLIGVGLIAIWNQPATQAVYTSYLMPVMAAIARFAPLAAILLLTQLKRRDPSLIDAARVLQRDDLHTWVKVRLPLLSPGLLGTAAIIFILTAGELGATLLVAPPGKATLTMRIYNFLHYGASDTVSGLGLLMTLIALSFGTLTILALSSWRRHSSREVP